MNNLEANRLLKVADHMLTTTYPLLKDPRLLLSILKNIMNSMDSNIDLVLKNAREKKLISVYDDTPEGRLTMFKRYYKKQPLIIKKCLIALSEMKELLKEHKESPVEFSKKEKFVICNKDYKIKIINQEKLKDYLIIARKFHMVINDGI